MATRMKPKCKQCGEKFSAKRKRAGYDFCMSCGDVRAVEARRGWCVAPMHKSNYMLFTTTEDLKGINNKGGLVK